MSFEMGRAGDHRRNLLGIDGMDRSELERILQVTDRFAEVGRRPIPKVPALRGRTIASVFFEASTRTRLSFESAARRLSADTKTFTAGTSTLNKVCLLYPTAAADDT